MRIINSVTYKHKNVETTVSTSGVTVVCRFEKNSQVIKFDRMQDIKNLYDALAYVISDEEELNVRK